MPKTSRRSFIKAKLLGSLFLLSGLPLFSITNSKHRRQPLTTFKLSDGSIDWESIRKEFQIKTGNHFFNTASLGPSPVAVIDTICESLRLNDSIPREGYQDRPKVRKKVAQLLNAKPNEIAMTRNTTEGMNIIARGLNLKRGDEVILTTHEHIGGSAPWLALKKEMGITIKLVDLDLQGRENYDRIERAITSNTKVVSFSHVTCTTGMQLPAKQIVELCRSRGIYSCVDGAQVIGMLPLDLSDLNPDFYVGNGHKWLFGPKGTGILYINERQINQSSPVFVGAFTDSHFNLKSLELEYLDKASRVEYGTRNTSLMLGLGAAVDFVSSIGVEAIAERSYLLSNRFRSQLEAMPEVLILSPQKQSLGAPMVTFRIKNQNQDEMVRRLNKEKSIRLRKIYECDLNAIRASFAIFNTESEVDYLVESIKEVAAS